MYDVAFLYHCHFRLIVISCHLLSMAKLSADQIDDVPQPYNTIAFFCRRRHRLCCCCCFYCFESANVNSNCDIKFPLQYASFGIFFVFIYSKYNYESGARRVIDGKQVLLRRRRFLIAQLVNSFQVSLVCVKQYEFKNEKISVGCRSVQCTGFSLLGHQKIA